MKIITIVLVALMMSFVFSACSASRQEFIIVNNSDADLIIQYSYYDKTRIVYKPRVTSGEQFDDPGKKWREISTKFFDVDGETRIVRIKLDPDQALLINTEENYKGKKSKDFPLSMIALNGNDGNQLFQNEDVQEAFEKQDNGNYAIFYK